VTDLANIVISTDVVMLPLQFLFFASNKHLFLH